MQWSCLLPFKLVVPLFFACATVLLPSCKKPPADPPADNDLVYFPPGGGSEWQTRSPESLGWNLAAVPELTQLLEQNGTRAFIILIEGRIVMEYYFGKTLLGAPFGRNSNWYWASAGKTLTSWMVGRAQEQGFLKLNDPASKYLGNGWTSLTPAQEGSITIWHQLTMTTGLDERSGNGEDTAAASLIYRSDPGTRWAYHNAPYTLLERVVSNAAGKDYVQYFNEQLKNPIGMDGFWQWTGNNHVYYSTARSMARFGWLVLNNGNWSGQQLLSTTGFVNEMRNSSQELNKSYGYLWWLNGKESYRMPVVQILFQGSWNPDAPSDLYAGLGKNGQFLQIIPSKKMVLVRMGEAPDQSPVPVTFSNDIWKVLNKIIR